jgi:hypothetical protein
MVIERFVLVDWSYNNREQTKLVCMERRGWSMSPRDAIKFHAESLSDLVRRIVQFCIKHECAPLIEAVGTGEQLLYAVTEALGPKWPPDPLEYVPQRDAK